MGVVLMSKTRLAEHYPDNFVDSPRPGMHIVLFYEEPERGRQLIFRYILRGLEKEEHCCYSVSDEDPDLVTAQMIDYGIDVKHYAERKKLLHIFKVQNPMNFPRSSDLMKEATRITQAINGKVDGRCRIVARWIPDVIRTKEAEQANLTIESSEGLRAKPGMSILCPRYVKNIEKRIDDGRWMRELLQIHDAVIFLPRNSDGLAMNLR